MTKILLLLICVLAITNIGFAQKTISGKSSKKSFTPKGQFAKQDLPPNLYVDLKFNDDNGNGVLEAEEKAELIVNITNKGKGIAQGLEVILKIENYDPDITFDKKKKVLYLYPDKTASLIFNFQAGLVSETKQHKFTIQVKEIFGYDTDEAYLVLNTLKYQQPEIVFSGYEIIDTGEGTATINADGLIQSGEKVFVKFYIQNIGQSTALNTIAEITIQNTNIYLTNNKQIIEDIAIGEVKNFIIGLSPNNRVDNSFVLFLNVNIDKKKGSLKNYKIEIPLNQSAPEPVVLNVEANIKRLQNQVAKFEYTSQKFSANIGTIERINIAPKSKTDNSNAIGVVIGIEYYDNIAPAPYAENDAKIIADYFKTTLGINKVVSFNSAEAKGLFFDDIFNAEYGELQKEIIKGKTDVFVFYSGHGLPSKDGKNAYLFPSDGKIERLTKQGYNLNDFYNNLNKLGAKSITVFMDACFSGASKTSDNKPIENLLSMKGVKINPKIIQPWQTNSNFSVFSSSQADETSLAFDDSKTGLFTYYLCLGLQGKADLNVDKKITFDELQLYVTSKVKEVSKKLVGIQTPQFNGNKTSVIVKY